MLDAVIDINILEVLSVDEYFFQLCSNRLFSFYFVDVHAFGNNLF